MIAVARAKAARAGRAVDFQVGVIEALAFPHGTFDVVFSSLMMHHLPDDLKRRGLVEIARVLRPGGRLLIVDIKRPTSRLGQAMTTLMLHGGLEHGIQDLPAMLRAAGFTHIDTGATGFSLLGMGASSDGKVFFFDAWDLTVLDALPSVTAVQNVVLQDPAGAIQALNEMNGLMASTNFTVKEGVARDENIVITYEGLVPGLVNLPTSDAEGQQFKFPPELADRLSEGDIIVPLNESGAV